MTWSPRRGAPLNQKPSYGGGPSTKDRVICGFSYLSLGMLGLIVYLLQQGKGQSRFFMFHFYQSIMCGLFWMMINWGLSAFGQVFGGLFASVPGASEPLGYVFMVFGLIPRLLLFVFAYGAVMTFLGKECTIPGITKIVRMQLR
jgi:hypothetical protein